jgi:hypothetical protein
MPERLNEPCSMPIPSELTPIFNAYIGKKGATIFIASMEMNMLPRSIAKSRLFICTFPKLIKGININENESFRGISLIQLSSLEFALVSTRSDRQVFKKKINTPLDQITAHASATKAMTLKGSKHCIGELDSLLWNAYLMNGRQRGRTGISRGGCQNSPDGRNHGGAPAGNFHFRVFQQKPSSAWV